MSDYQKENQYDERVIDIARVAKVVKGGRRFSFRVVMVIGDNAGRVGLGIRKANDKARKDMRKINLNGTTISHQVVGKQSGAKVLLRPAAPGTGVIAGGGVRAVVEAAGVHDILTKSLGSSNILNVVRATFNALDQVKSPAAQAAYRGKPIDEVRPYWERETNG